MGVLKPADPHAYVLETGLAAEATNEEGVADLQALHHRDVPSSRRSQTWLGSRLHIGANAVLDAR